jgi:hypothetical protein
MVLPETGEAGCVRVKVLIAWHPKASVIVQVYEAAERPEAVELVPPVGAHEYV